MWGGDEGETGGAVGGCWMGHFGLCTLFLTVRLAGPMLLGVGGRLGGGGAEGLGRGLKVAGRRH